MNWKKILRILLIIFLMGLAYGTWYLIRYAAIGVGYNAKIMCSCHFISGRTQASIEQEDLYAIPFAKQAIDEEHKTVTSTIYGVVSKTAMYRPGFGCTLVNGVTLDQLKQTSPLFQRRSDSFEFPDDSVVSDTLRSKLRSILDRAFDDHSVLQRTRAVVIIHNGHLVMERYAAGFSPQTPMMGWSMTKSVTNAMIGRLVELKGTDIYASSLFDEWKRDERKSIQLDHLLRMVSGLRFEENYTRISDATRMLFAEKNAGMYALSRPIAYKPGEYWYYSSGTTNILQEYIKRKLGPDYIAFPYVELFDKIGMSSAIMEQDPGGTYVGSSFMYASARDWAKLGQLFLQDGVWKDQRLLPQGWATYSSKETPASKGEYAAQFWIYHRKSGLPADAYLMDGFEGQYVQIIPSKKLVVVRLGCTPGSGKFEDSLFFKEISDLF